MTYDHTRDMGRCYLNNLGECLAKIPAACQCARMPKFVVEDYLKKYGIIPDGETGSGSEK